LNSLFCVNEKRIVFGDRKSVFKWMPSSHLNFLAHVNFRRFFLGCWISIILRNNFLTLISSVGAGVLSSLVHELDVNTAIGLVFDIYNMDVGIVTTGDHHA